MTAVVLRGDARRLPLPDACVDLIVTSPPYFGLRSYTDEGYCAECRLMREQGRDPKQAWPDYDAHWAEVHAPRHYEGQIGSEATPQEWLAALVACTAEWVRVLKPSGSIFVNLGDKYSTGNSGQSNLATWSAEHAAGGAHADVAAKRRSPRVEGMPPKSLLGLPWRYAIAATDQLGLILRRDIIWNKPNGLPESVTDRCRSSHEYLFHLVRQPRYYAAVDEIREGYARPDHTEIGNRHAGQRKWEGVAAETGSENRWNVGVRQLHPLGKLPGSVWSIPSQPLTVPAHLGIDHFAAFPMELPRRIILGWSPPGVCTACGEGRRPVVHRVTTGHDNRKQSRGDGARDGSQDLSPRSSKAWWDFKMAGGGDRITGYACACPAPDAPTRPALVLDPFGGTGTTALVAAMHGRRGLSFDLSHDYSRLARWRTQDPAQRAAAMCVPKPPPVPDGMEPLFAI